MAENINGVSNSMNNKQALPKIYSEPIFWLTLIAYVAVAVGVAAYIDRFTIAGTSATPRDLGFSTAACLPFLLLEFIGIIGGSALFVGGRTRSVGLGLLVGVPAALIGIVLFIAFWGG